MNKFLNAIALLLMALLLSEQSLAADNGRNLAVNQVNPAVNEQRIALVIGNGAYTNSPLKNPVNDAKDVAKKLRWLGFNVVERNNLKKEQIGATLREFRSKLAPGSVALVFYAGHGLQIKGINYLPAVDAEINSEEDVPNQSIAVNQIMDVLDESKTRLNLVFLDACRNNPYARSFRSAERGLARISAPSGTLISYATKPGSVAADGDGRNGLYTSKLLAQMDSTLLIEQTLKRVVTEVNAASQGKQESWMEGSIEGDFCFAGCAASGGTQQASLVSARVKTRDEIEQDAWESVRDSANIGAIQEYLKQYPKGQYVGQARILITTLKTTPAKPSEPTATPAREDGDTALWAEVQKGNSKDDYDAYLAQYPRGKYVALANSRINKLQDEAATEATRREQELWQQAQADEKGQTVQAYLDKYPSGSHTNAAQEKLAAIKKAETEMKPGKVFRDCPDCPEMVILPKSFAMGKYEVTQAEWRAVMGSNPSEFSNCGDNCPVENVSWNDAQVFIQKLNTKTGKQYQLPSGAEWEYACYGGSQSEYCGGNNLDALGWADSPFTGKTHPAGQKQANGYGLYDMSGNVWEWTNECYNGNCESRVLRGGSWKNEPQDARVARRIRGRACVPWQHLRVSSCQDAPVSVVVGASTPRLSYSLE